jgi:hypothetical protein
VGEIWQQRKDTREDEDCATVTVEYYWEVFFNQESFEARRPSRAVTTSGTARSESSTGNKSVP